MGIEITSQGCSATPSQARDILNAKLAQHLQLESQSKVVFTDELPGGEYYPAWCWRPSVDPDMVIHIHQESWDSPRRLLKLYLHELSHVLIVRADPRLAGHNWPFAAMNAVLLRRAEGHLRGRSDDPLIAGLSLYDVGDEPESRWPRAIQKALQISSQLAPSSSSAETCAEAIASLWSDQIKKPGKARPAWRFW